MICKMSETNSLNIEGLISVATKLKSTLATVQEDIALKVIGKCFKIKSITHARIVAVNIDAGKVIFETVESSYDHRNHLWCIIRYEEANLSTVWESKDLFIPSNSLEYNNNLAAALRMAGTRWDMKCVKDLRGAFMETHQVSDYIWG